MGGYVRRSLPDSKGQCLDLGPPNLQNCKKINYCSLKVIQFVVLFIDVLRHKLLCCYYTEKPFNTLDAPQLTMGFCSDKLIGNWKYPKLKTHSMHLTFRASNLSNTVGYWLFSLKIMWFPGNCGRWLLPTIMRVHCTSPGKDRHSKFKVWFLLNAYYFCTMPNSHKLNHHKLGIICNLCWKCAD